ncbi:hypothetical protein AAIR98_000855 [Elusimicrobium simillimum]|uniref:hypothetical protein n=1 Tax=Elusimicrobium simillimum TaxID=3143438 RepID=UPI003C7056DD
MKDKTLIKVGQDMNNTAIFGDVQMEVDGGVCIESTEEGLFVALNLKEANIEVGERRELKIKTISPIKERLYTFWKAELKEKFDISHIFKMIADTSKKPSARYGEIRDL